MAIKPNDSDVFLREVDEELRRERMNRFMTRYGWAIIAGIVLFLGAIGGWIWWQNRQQQQAAAEGETLVGALESLEAGNAKAAEPEIARLAESDREGYRLAALFTRANMQIQSGNRAAAVATLKSIAADEDAAEPSRPPRPALVRKRRRAGRRGLSQDGPAAARRAAVPADRPRRDGAADDPYKSRSDGGLFRFQCTRGAGRSSRGARCRAGGRARNEGRD